MKMVTTRYKIISRKLPTAFDGFKIAHVSDLHNREFGNELIRAVAEEKPNIIAITGDIIHRENESAAAEKFALGAVQVAPVYYVAGNHEKVLSCYPAFAAYLSDIGVNVLKNEYKTIERDGEKIAVIGMNDPTFFQKGKTDFVAELNRLHACVEEEGVAFSVLLSHRPEMFARYVEAGIDLSLTGHAHGGHVRLPFIGAFYAPNQGLMPKYTEGVHTHCGKSMVISKGLGKSSWVPRMFNPPELVIETLCSIGGETPATEIFPQTCETESEQPEQNLDANDETDKNDENTQEAKD